MTEQYQRNGSRAPYAGISEQLSIEWLNGEQLRTLTLLVRADVRPEVLYAFSKTGVVVSDLNRCHVPQKIVATWDDAVQEYRHRDSLALIVDKCIPA